jgi:hypothetical protein
LFKWGIWFFGFGEFFGEFKFVPMKFATTLLTALALFGPVVYCEDEGDGSQEGDAEGEC